MLLSDVCTFVDVVPFSRYSISVHCLISYLTHATWIVACTEIVLLMVLCLINLLSVLTVTILGCLLFRNDVIVSREHAVISMMHQVLFSQILLACMTSTISQ